MAKKCNASLRIDETTFGKGQKFNDDTPIKIYRYNKKLRSFNKFKRNIHNKEDKEKHSLERRLTNDDIVFTVKKTVNVSYCAVELLASCSTPRLFPV